MIIELPSAFDQEQLESVVAILSNNLPPTVKPGIQLLQTDVTRREFRDLENLIRSNVPQHFRLEVHAPICPHSPRTDLNLAHPKSADIILANAFFADAIGATALIVHTNTVYYPPEEGRDPATVWDQANDNFGAMCFNIREKVYQTLFTLAEKSPVVVGVENMPLPINGDRCSTASGIIYEPNMTTLEDLLEFCAKTKTASKLKVVYDTAHGLLARGIINQLIGCGIHSSTELRCTPFRGIYPETIGPQPEIDVTLREIYAKGKLASVQISEVSGGWKEGQVLQEDTPLGGKDYPSLLRIAKFLRDAGADIPLSLDIGEEDYTQRPNQRASLKRLLRDLYN